MIGYILAASVASLAGVATGAVLGFRWAWRFLSVEPLSGPETAAEPRGVPATPARPVAPPTTRSSPVIEPVITLRAGLSEAEVEALMSAWRACGHWVTGPDGERIMTPTFGCPHCTA